MRKEDRLNYEVVKYFRERALGFIFHIPNEGVRSARQAASLIAQGLTAGVPDFFVALKNGRSFFVELKTEKGRLSKRQKVVVKQLNECNQRVYLCRTIQEFQAGIRERAGWCQRASGYLFQNN
ncbi:MAG: hypothetical protein KatS3mg031_2871 [Chitinophagales bacterium]|nr:MAG: hypothetical protein KatS3mg031_2871 [Chitinophagales bacterium]